MQEREERGAGSISSPESVGKPPLQPRATVLPLGQHERRIIFHEMVKAELEGGLLRYSKRKQLLHYAGKIGIPNFEACLMIAEVQHSEGQLEAPRILTDEEILSKLQEANQANSAMRRIVIASAAAIVVNVWMLHWIF